MKHLSPTQQKRGFAIHAICAVLGMTAALVVNLLIGSPYWVQYVLVGWGIGLLSHWWFVLGPGAGKVDNI